MISLYMCSGICTCQKPFTFPSQCPSNRRSQMFSANTKSYYSLHTLATLFIVRCIAQIVSDYKLCCTKWCVCDCVFSNMPDPVLESQLTSVLTGPDLTSQQQNILIGPELQAKRSAIFVSLYNASRYYGTR